MESMDVNKFRYLTNYKGYVPQFMFNTFNLNRSKGNFSEIGHFLGIAETDWSWAALLVDFDFDFVLLLEVLELTLLVAKLGLLVLEFFLADQPEVVDTKTLVIVMSDLTLFLLDHVFEFTALNTQGPLKLVVIDIVDGVGARLGLLLGVLLWWLWLGLGWHF